MKYNCCDYKLSPSDFTFLYEECKRCYYLKVKLNISQPSIPLPSIFSKMTGLLKDYYNRKRTEEIFSELGFKEGVVEYAERYVESKPIPLQISGRDVTCCIYGKFDILIKFDNGEYGLIDFKIGNPNEEHRKLYSRQLHAYLYALEHPTLETIERLKLSPPISVTKLGLLYFYPSEVSQLKNKGYFSFNAKIEWVEIPKDEERFLNFIKEVVELLESSEPPNLSLTCKWCEYLQKLNDEEYIDIKKRDDYYSI